MNTSELRDAAQKTVLVVEDSPTQALHLQSLLEQENLQVACAWNGQVGLQMAHQVHPDVIVLDVQMPDLNGFQVYQRLKETDDTASIPVIMLTRHDDPDAITLGLQVGVTDYIPKDAFADAVLLETLRQMRVIQPSEGR